MFEPFALPIIGYIVERVFKEINKVTSPITSPTKQPIRLATQMPSFQETIATKKDASINHQAVVETSGSTRCPLVFPHQIPRAVVMINRVSKNSPKIAQYAIASAEFS